MGSHDPKVLGSDYQIDKNVKAQPLTKEVGWSAMLAVLVICPHKCLLKLHLDLVLKFRPTEAVGKFILDKGNYLICLSNEIASSFASYYFGSNSSYTVMGK